MDAMNRYFAICILAPLSLFLSQNARGAALGLHAGKDSSIAQYEEFGSWLGSPVLFRITFDSGESWQSISAPYFLSSMTQWLKSDMRRHETISVPLVPNKATTADLRAVASGAHDDIFRALAEHLKSTGAPNRTIVRLGWEFNGTWFSWSAIPDPSAYVRAFRQVVKTMRKVSPELRFEWNLSCQSMPNFEWSKAYPGDDVVDIVSMDVYDQYSRNWNDVLHSPSGLEALRRFAKAHNKPEAYPEWSVSTSLHGNGDAPDFVMHMANWFATGGARVLYQSYWNTPSGGPNAALAGPSSGRVPKSATEYRRLFSKPLP